MAPVPDESKAGRAPRLRLDPSLRCVGGTSAQRLLFGEPAETWVGKYFPDLISPGDRDMVVEILMSALEEGAGALLRADFEVAGKTYRLELVVSPADSTGDDGAHLELVCRDVSAPPNRSMAPAAVDRGQPDSSSELFRARVENMQESVLEIGEDGRVLYVSPSHTRMLGGEGSEPSLESILGAVHPEDRAQVERFCRPGWNRGRQQRLVYRAQSARGDELELESSAQEFEGPDGRPRVVVVTRDVTDRENARRKLERQIALETSIADLSRFFVDIDVDGVEAGIVDRLGILGELAHVEHSWLYSFSTGQGGFELFDWWREEEKSRHPVAPERSSECFPYSTGLISSGELYHVPYVDSLPVEAEPEKVDMRARGVRSILGIPIMSGGRFVGCLGFESFEREIDWSEETIVLLRIAGEIFYSTLRRRRAVEDLRDSQVQLLQAQKMEAVGTLAGGIAHDFNNHLAVLLGNARFVRQEVEGSADLVEAIDDLERSAEHLAQLTRSLLAFSRRSPVEVLPVAVEELVEGVEALIRPLLPSSIHLSVSVDPGVGRISVDRVQIQQVLVNLIVNARDAMPNGGPLRLHATRRTLERAEASALDLPLGPRYIELSVEDSGIGMDEATLSRVFEPFFTTKSMGEGTGLGLSMAYGIVLQSEGAISVESRPGQGATFRVYLPECVEG